MSSLLEPFAYAYMTNAMWVSALVGGVCAFLSAYLMLKGWSLIGDALSHSIVPGVAGAYLLGLPFSLGAFLAGGLALQAIGLGWIAAVSSADVSYSSLVGPFIVCGIGMGMFFAPVANIVLSAVPQRDEVLSVRGVGATLGGREVLNDIDFSIAAGEFTGLIGSNGAGKTTLFRVILGSAAASGGAVLVGGAPRSRRNPQIGYVPQKFALDPDLPLRPSSFVRHHEGMLVSAVPAGAQVLGGGGLVWVDRDGCVVVLSQYE